jgi:hypothetical protein
MRFGVLTFVTDEGIGPVELGVEQVLLHLETEPRDPTLQLLDQTSAVVAQLS